MKAFSTALLIFAVSSTQVYALHSYSSHPGQVGQVLMTEPNVVGFGDVVLVDDKSCPPGQVKEITGGNRNKGIARTKKCIPH